MEMKKWFMQVSPNIISLLGYLLYLLFIVNVRTELLKQNYGEGRECHIIVESQHTVLKITKPCNLMVQDKEMGGIKWLVLL